MIPESPRWLIAKGKKIEAEILLDRFIKYNALYARSTSKNMVCNTDFKEKYDAAKKKVDNPGTNEKPYVDDGRISEESRNLLTLPKEIDKKAQGN